jgi:hypothetical protein
MDKMNQLSVCFIKLICKGLEAPLHAHKSLRLLVSLRLSVFRQGHHCF